MDSKKIAVMLVLAVLAVAFVPSDAAPAGEVLVVNGRQPYSPYGTTMNRGSQGSTVIVMPRDSAYRRRRCGRSIRNMRMRSGARRGIWRGADNIRFGPRVFRQRLNNMIPRRRENQTPYGSGVLMK